MKIHHWLAPALFILAAASSLPAAAFENVCPYHGQARDEIAQNYRVNPAVVPRIAASYCANVGRKAYNAIGPDRIRHTYLGPILGVTWINTGDIVGQPGTPPRVARNSGFMYLIGPGGIANHIFFRWGPEIAGR